ncbi:acyl-CoA dehydrogenase family protein [Longirhabdus pacifica]|uniref:acyl-CoA dehydrogenase family protein n=1 Tax=Longirhabdus pacifica TaxID=2305227 RepID=UPI0010088C53|nr:acyl-CoA dehydrogenase family protein [Longirhabdus pacifica]
MEKTLFKGGSFIIDNLEPHDIVTPEDFTDEQKMFKKTAADFLEGEILTREEDIEKLDYELTVQLMRQAGELGLLGADVPEEYGGLALDKVSSGIIAETMARTASFSLSVGAHTGIGTGPIIFFGNDDQKAKYLPLLATGEKIAAYCLTEPGSGSDAMAAKTTATLSEDGQHYILNGSKVYITNGAFADIFIVYAKIDGEKFTGFIVEKEYEGFKIGAEEKKMGIKGSSTVPLYFEDMKVPVENVLGEIGKGHLIAFNILNLGRYKLAAGCLGASKEAISISSEFANTREQFKRPISKFPLIQSKLAEMNIKTFVTESMFYRTSGLLDDALEAVDPADTDKMKNAKAIGDYAIECSINKVFSSEALDFIVDEGVQIHGGSGFIQEYKIERMYRDARINRIFEGTNEINRLIIPGTLVRKALKGELPLMNKLQALQGELVSFRSQQVFDGLLSKETYLLDNVKKLFLMVGGLAVQKYGEKLDKEQEILAAISDLMISAFAMESVLLRTKKQLAKDDSKDYLSVAMTQVYIQETFEEMMKVGKHALAAMEEGDSLHTQMSIVRKMARFTPDNLVELKRNIAAQVITKQQYCV